MFERNKGSYGLDDDPFLTRPAGPGSAHGRPASRVYQPQAPAAAAHPVPVYPPMHGARQAPVIAPRGGQGYGAAQDRSFAQAGYDQPAGYAPAGYTSDGYGADEYGADGYGVNEYGADPYGQRAYDQGQADPYHAPRVQTAAYPQNTAALPHAGHYGAQGYGPEYGSSHARAPYAQPQAVQAAAPQHKHRPRAAVPQDGADFAVPTYGAAPEFGAQRSGVMQWAGALCTVAVLLGAVYWGYALAVRDASGIPVVRAAMGPLRIAPEAPGGEVSAHQGLAVNAIPAAGLGQELPQEITLAPQTDDLSAADTITESGSFAQIGGENGAQIVLGASDGILTMPQSGAGGAVDLTALPDALPEDMPLSDEEAVVRALEMALAEGGDFEAEPAFADTVLSEPVGMSAASPSSLPPDMTPVLPPTAEVDPATIAPGTAMVQLGAFDDEALARAEWANLQTRFTELVAQKALVVQQAQSGGRNFYRLRAHGFDGPDETRRFCAAILAENGTCLPVVQR